MSSYYKKTITLGLKYDEFQKGMAECDKSMKTLEAEYKVHQAQMEKTASKSDKLADKNAYLSTKIDMQREKVEKCREKMKQLAETEGATAAQVNKAQQELSKQEATLASLQNELDETVLAQSNLKQSAAALAATVAAVSTAFLSCAKDAAKFADDVITISDQTGVSTKRLQEWAYAADLVDVSTETMTGALSKLTKNMASVQNKSGDVYKTFKQLGLTVYDTRGHLKSADDMFLEVIDALGKIDNQTKRDQIAMQIFGKSAQDLAGVIKAGSGGLKAYGDEAERLGLIMSEKDLEAAGAFQDAMDKLDSVLGSVKNNIGLTVIPMLTALLEAIAAIPAPVLSTIVVVLSIVATLVTLTSTINSVVKAGSAVSSGIKLLSGHMDAFTLKIIAITVAVTALVAIIAVLLGKGSELRGTMESITNLSTASLGGPVGHNANGTQNWRGGATWVGENGPEIVQLPRGSRIYNNQESMAMAGGGTYYITMDCDLSKMRSVSDVVDAVQNLGLSAGRGGRL